MDENKPTYRLSLSIGLCSVAGLVMAGLYVLSVGPACWLVIHGYLYDDIYATVYYSLFKAAEISSLLGDFVVFWINWWVPMEDILNSIDSI